MSEKLASIPGVLPIIGIFVVVLGGIYLGIFTVTESGAIGVAASLIIALLTKSLTRKKFWIALKETLLMVCMMMFLLGGAQVFAMCMTLSRLPFRLSEWIISMNMSYPMLVIMLSVVYVILGIVLPENSTLVLTVPILFPAMMLLGLDPLWFGVFVTLQIALGSITPPIGMAIFIISAMTGVSPMRVFKMCTPFLIGDAIVIILVAVFPAMATFLPSLM